MVVEAQAGQQIDTQSGQMSTNLSTQEVLELAAKQPEPSGTRSDVARRAGRQRLRIQQRRQFLSERQPPTREQFPESTAKTTTITAIAGQAFQPTNIGAVEEVTILTNAYSAEYGRGGGSVTNYVFGSGTNQFHGKAWDINHPSDVDATLAETAFAGSAKPVSIENIFGFNFGGPIKHDKLFVFGTAQWDRFRSTANGDAIAVPTDAGFSTLQGVLPTLTSSRPIELELSVDFIRFSSRDFRQRRGHRFG